MRLHVLKARLRILKARLHVLRSCPSWESRGAREGLWPMAFWPGIYRGWDDKEACLLVSIRGRVARAPA
jgi:hypothetical protein